MAERTHILRRPCLHCKNSFVCQIYQPVCVSLRQPRFIPQCSSVGQIYQPTVLQTTLGQSPPSAVDTAWATLIMQIRFFNCESSLSSLPFGNETVPFPCMQQIWNFVVYARALSRLAFLYGVRGPWKWSWRILSRMVGICKKNYCQCLLSYGRSS